MGPARSAIRVAARVGVAEVFRSQLMNRYIYITARVVGATLAVFTVFLFGFTSELGIQYYSWFLRSDLYNELIPIAAILYLSSYVKIYIIEVFSIQILPSINYKFEKKEDTGNYKISIFRKFVKSYCRFAFRAYVLIFFLSSTLFYVLMYIGNATLGVALILVHLIIISSYFSRYGKIAEKILITHVMAAFLVFSWLAGLCYFRFLTTESRNSVISLASGDFISGKILAEQKDGYIFYEASNMELKIISKNIIVYIK